MYRSGNSYPAITDGGTCPGAYCGAGEYITWDLGVLPPGASRRVSVSDFAHPDAANGTLIPFEAELFDGASLVGSASHTLLVAPLPDTDGDGIVDDLDPDDDNDGVDLLTETTLHHAIRHLKRLIGFETGPDTTLTLEIERLDFPPHRWALRNLPIVEPPPPWTL